MLRAEPAMVFTAASKLAAVKSGSFVLAISSNCSRVTLPTFSVLGRPEPLFMPAAFLSKKEAGGVLVRNVKERSS